MTDLPSVTGTSRTPISILLINPNSTSSMTASCLSSLSRTLPADVTVTGFTAPPTAPTAIEGRLDGILSAADCIRSLAPTAHKYDAFLVACFSAHPLIPALREEYTQPCIGIMEAALYASRMCGDRLGVITTSQRSKILHEQSIATYGFSAYSAGTEAAHVAVLELESKPRYEVYAGLTAAATRLTTEKGADCVCLGCAGMTEMQEVCRQAVGMHQERKTMVVDGVTMGVHFLIGLVREGLGTAKGGAYRNSKDGRQTRGQDYL